ncbi:MAG TPA: DegT/DnrJ/EryC1/StrS aminotransferase family protein, partial [Anaerolineae bacterium]|nr:DegT/DnrJ/EryC1/StrS aminotransferase family protein [Anaerolineae bacterium]
MRNTFLPFSPPLIGEEEIAEVLDTLRSDWLTTGPKVKRFEQEFAEFVGAPAALAVSSATDAMQVALAALGIGPGDEVITTTMTFCSTVHVIEHVGARPVLVDVLPDTLTLDPARVAEALTPRTRALLPVHLYGHPCEMDALLELAQQHHLAIVEDAAHALPARYKGRLIGAALTASDLATCNSQLTTHNSQLATCFSFYATKNLTTAEGGMVTGEADLIDRARIWSLHGMSRDAWKRYGTVGSWYYEVVLPGFKCNMTDIQAALGLQQLHKL